MEKSILETLGVEIIGVMSPVSICMLLVVLIVSALPPDLSSPPLRTAATLLYLESPSDPPSQKLTGALLNAAAFVVLIALVTFLLLLLYYYRFTLFLKHYIHFSSFFVFSSMGAPIFFSLLRNLNLPLDSLTSILLLFNFTVVGVFSVFSPAVPIVVRQGYMVALAVIVAAWFAKLPEWTTWVLLVALAVYDLVAVLAPGGPLKLLVELASSREEDLPALIYEARPAMNPNPRPIAPLAGVIGSFVAVVGSDPGSVELQRLAAPRRSDYSAIEMEQGESPRMAYDSAIEIEQEEHEEGSERSPLVGGNSRRIMDSVNNYESAIDEDEMSPLTATSAEREGGMEVEMSRGIKLGLGDFVFYSVLVGRAAMYDLMTVYACYLAIISGLGCTLILLSVAHRALPALPISIALGVMFYFLTRLLMEPFVVGTSTNLMMF